MLPHNVTAVVARNEDWRGSAATEPYECGWAREAVVFVRALKVAGMPLGVAARVQVSPDGMQSFVRVAHFGGWLRLTADLPDGATISVLVTLHLKA